MKQTISIILVSSILCLNAFGSESVEEYIEERIQLIENLLNQDSFSEEKQSKISIAHSSALTKIARTARKDGFVSKKQKAWVEKLNELTKKIVIKTFNSAIDHENNEDYATAYSLYRSINGAKTHEITGARTRNFFRKPLGFTLHQYNLGLINLEGKGKRKHILDASWNFYRVFNPNGKDPYIDPDNEVKGKAAYNLALIYCRYPVVIGSYATFPKSEESLLRTGKRECSNNAKKALEFGYDKQELNNMLSAYELEPLK